MFEIRWLVKQDGTRVLQFRSRIYDGPTQMDWHWSEWWDVPEVKASTDGHVMLVS